MGAQFSIPLQTVIPGQLIASSLWNGEWNNLNTNLIPAGIDSYSDTDAQMQIQTNPYPGSVTSHASNLGGELERIRYQIAALAGNTYWYQSVVGGNPIFTSVTVNGASSTPAFILSIGGIQQSQIIINTTDTFIDFGGTIGRLFFRAGINGSVAMTLTPVALNLNGHQINNVAAPSVAGDVLINGTGVISGAASNTGPTGQIAAGTISTTDIRAQAVTSALLGIVAGSGISGGVGAALTANVDNVTLDVNGSSQIEIKAGGVGSTQIANGAVTNSNSTSIGSGAFPATSHTPTTVMTTSLTTLAGTVVITTVSGKLTTGSGTGVAVRIVRDATVIYYITFTSGQIVNISVADTPGAGAHTYSFTVETSVDGPPVTGGSTIMEMSSTEFRK